MTPLIDVSVGEILGQCIGLEPGRWTRADQMRAGAYLKAKGWERYQTRKAKGRHGAKEWRYRDPTPAGTASRPKGRGTHRLRHARDRARRAGRHAASRVPLAAGLAHRSFRVRSIR